ncbi:MAG: phytoene/squalene synthase family protein [Pseudomonadota bacterium]
MASRETGWFGPAWSEAALADFAACAEAIRHGSHSFHAAGRFLPARLRRPAHAIYAFCRLADDAVDLGTGNKHAAVERLYHRLDRLYAGQPLDAAPDRALARTVEAFDLPKALPEALIEGLAWDAEGRRYATLSALSDYAARVAGAVGGMMAVLLGVRSERMLARACDLGVAMQLTNIARDVGEDARNGRVYLPLDWLAEAWIDPEALIAEPRHTPALARVVARLLREADTLYLRAEAGIARLPRDCRPAIYAARFLYAEIGREVARAGYNAIDSRAVVSPVCKLALAAKAARTSVLPLKRTWALAKPALDETRYLVEAATSTPAPLPDWGDRVAWVVDLWAEMELRDRLQATARPAVRSGAGR